MRRKLTDKEAEVIDQTAYWIGFEAALEQALELFGQHKDHTVTYHKATYTAEQVRQSLLKLMEEK